MTKHFLLGISILPALLVMPAMAADVATTETFYDDVLQADGRQIASGSDLIIDFNGHTYSAFSNPVGSSGTENQLFQLLRDSTVTFQNGTLNVSENPTANFRFLIQNYSNLTLDNMVLNGSGLTYPTQTIAKTPYTLSNNFGSTLIKNSTIIGKEGGVAFDVYYDSEAYGDGVNVTVQDSTINGNIEVDSDGKDTAENVLTKAVLNFKGVNTINGNITNEGTININTTDDAASTITGSIDNSGALNINNTTFTGGEALKGGAILNSGSLTLSGGSFTGNTATGTGKDAADKDMGGGAIYSDLSTSVTDIDNVSFVGNSANYIGGAVYVYSGTANINNSTFTDNSANWGGAIYTKARPEDGQQISDLVINNSTFTNNSAKSVGAVGVMRKGIITNTTFTDNHATDSTDDGAGALFLGSESYTTLTGGSFVDNASAAAGGAIGTRDFGQGGNVDAKLDINGTRFEHNIAATSGGAIDNYFYNDAANDGYVNVSNATFTLNGAANGGAIYNHAVVAQTGNMSINNSSFTSNTATVAGGAIYNEGTMQLANATFRNNSATAAGGAIYNAGTINLNGTNTFIGNTANGHANDIDSHGTLNIALGGTTTLSGGITGNGILNIADGATLNIGTGYVLQDTIRLDGTMLATLRGGDNAQITATSAFNGAGELKLAFDGEGLYHVFGGKVFTKENGIDLSSVVYDLTWSEDGKDVTASLKSVEDLAEENHLTTETAATIVNLTSSTSDVLNDLSVTIQEKLATGTEEARQEVEHAQVAINPEKESVVQSVTSSVQNAVSSLAMSRMSMPMGGRNGGDAKVTGRGVWVNGIFNKAKQNDAFNGYTRGFAAGLDGTINNKWTIGAGYSFAHSDVDGSARDTEIESSSVFVYGQYRRKAWYVNGVANYTMADYSEQGTALGMPVTADYDVKSYGANVATGYRFAGGITPELSLRYLHIDESDYVNSLGIKNELKESDYLTASLGTKYAFRIKVTKAFRLRPELSYAVKYDMLSDKQVANVTMPGLNSYALNGDRLSRIAGEFGIGLGARYKGLDVSLNYDIEAREDYTSQSGRLKFRYNF